MRTKQEGFDGEIRIVVPPLVLKESALKDRFNSFIITDIGYYPKAKNHFCKRGEGSSEHILIHCVAGRGVVFIDDEKYDLEANRYILIPAGASHAYQADHLNPWTIHWMHFIGKDANPIVEDLFKRIQANQNILPFDGRINAAFNQFCQLLAQGYSREILAYISMNLPHFFSGYLYPELQHDNSHAQHDIITRSIAFLKEHIASRVELAHIAQHVHLSVSHFSKLFKARTGYSPIEYLNHLKIQKACYLLQFSQKRISVIAYELGFDDQYYFSRLFKEHMGNSPLHYRNSVLTDNNKVH
ncbi:MAG: AraC family transcriptional regulator [Sphingobacterium sp.]